MDIYTAAWTSAIATIVSIFCSYRSLWNYHKHNWESFERDLHSTSAKDTGKLNGFIFSKKRHDAYGMVYIVITTVFWCICLHYMLKSNLWETILS